MFLMCSWIVASVPIPFSSILEMRPASVSGEGGDVSPRDI